MTFIMFSIFDSKASSFMLPFFAPNVAVAKRNIMRAVEDPDSHFGAFPEDYSLFEVGQWDGDTGKVVSAVAPLNHGLLSSFIRKEKE